MQSVKSIHPRSCQWKSRQVLGAIQLPDGGLLAPEACRAGFRAGADLPSPLPSRDPLDRASIVRRQLLEESRGRRWPWCGMPCAARRRIERNTLRSSHENRVGERVSRFTCEVTFAPREGSPRGPEPKMHAVDGCTLRELAPDKTGCTVIPLRMVWSSACSAATLNDNWRAIGAKTVAGARTPRAAPSQLLRALHCRVDKGNVGFGSAVEGSDTAAVGGPQTPAADQRWPSSRRCAISETVMVMAS
jgi:hypothetical protein